MKIVKSAVTKEGRKIELKDEGTTFGVRQYSIWIDGKTNGTTECSRIDAANAFTKALNEVV